MSVRMSFIGKRPFELCACKDDLSMSFQATNASRLESSVCSGLDDVVTHDYLNGPL